MTGKARLRTRREIPRNFSSSILLKPFRCGNNEIVSVARRLNENNCGTNGDSRASLFSANFSPFQSYPCVRARGNLGRLGPGKRSSFRPRNCFPVKRL